MANKKVIFLAISFIMLSVLSIGLSKAELFSVVQQTDCVWDEPEREGLVQFNSNLRSVMGYPPEPFMFFPEDGYFPLSPSEWDNQPIEGMLCEEFFEYFGGVVDETRNGKNIYYVFDGYAICLESGKLALSLGEDESRKNEVLDNYILNYYKCETKYFPSAEFNTIIDYFENYPKCDNNINKIWNLEGSKLFFVLDKNCVSILSSDYYFMEWDRDNFCPNWYLNPEADFLDASGQENWLITEKEKLGKKYFVVENSEYQDGHYWCHNPELLAYASSEQLMNKFFNDFYDECYTYLAETCQEVPCSWTQYTLYSSLEECQGIHSGGTCEELGGIICKGTKVCSGKYVFSSDTDKCCTPDTSVGLKGECGYPAEGSGCIFISDFCVKWWMLLLGIGALILLHPKG